jgi:hypothetical protein
MSEHYAFNSCSRVYNPYGNHGTVLEQAGKNPEPLYRVEWDAHYEGGQLIPSTITTVPQKGLTKVEAPTLSAFHVCATNDTNGGPRRCFVVVDAGSGSIVDVVDEGYEGEAGSLKPYAYPYGVIVLSHRVNVSPSEYKRWLKVGEERRAEASAGDC